MRHPPLGVYCPRQRTNRFIPGSTRYTPDREVRGAPMTQFAYWLLSGWIDVAMIGGWMALVIAVGLRAWKGGKK